jgi:hypothetical protein
LPQGQRAVPSPALDESRTYVVVNVYEKDYIMFNGEMQHL